MKSMRQMQNELLSKCKFDGSYPKPVVLFPGVIDLARNEAEHKALMRQVEIECYVFLGAAVVILIAFPVILCL